MAENYGNAFFQLFFWGFVKDIIEIKIQGIEIIFHRSLGVVQMIYLLVCLGMMGVGIFLMIRGIKKNTCMNHLKNNSKMIEATITEMQMVTKKHKKEKYYGDAHPICSYTVGDKAYSALCKDLSYECNLPIKSATFDISEHFTHYINKKINVLVDKENPEQIASLKILESSLWNKEMIQGVSLIIAALVLGDITFIFKRSVLLVASFVMLLAYIFKEIKIIRTEKQMVKKIEKYGEITKAKIIDMDTHSAYLRDRCYYIEAVPVIKYEVNGEVYYSRWKQEKYSKQLVKEYEGYKRDDKSFFSEYIDKEITICYLPNEPLKFIGYNMKRNVVISQSKLQIEFAVLFFIMAGLGLTTGINARLNSQDIINDSQDIINDSEGAITSSQHVTTPQEMVYISEEYIDERIRIEGDQEIILKKNLALSVSCNETKIEAKNFRVEARIYSNDRKFIAFGTLHYEEPQIDEALLKKGEKYTVVIPDQNLYFDYGLFYQQGVPYSIELKLLDSEDKVICKYETQLKVGTDETVPIMAVKSQWY